MPSTLFAPMIPGCGLARAHTNPITGNVYTSNGDGVFVSQDVDTPWFLSRGFVAAPAAAVYMPYDDRGMAREITNPNTGNRFTFNSAGFATGITGADLTWFLLQGFTQVPAGTVLVAPPQPFEGQNSLMISPAGNTYVPNARGFVVALAADLNWFYSQGFAPVGAGTLLAAAEEGPPDDEPVKAKRK